MRGIGYWTPHITVPESAETVKWKTISVSRTGPALAPLLDLGRYGVRVAAAGVPAAGGASTGTRTKVVV